jgi:hypothetical protein
MEQKEVILEMGVEGGSISITRVQSSTSVCAYVVVQDGTTLNEFLNDEDQMPVDDLHSTNSFSTLEDAFAYFGKHPWHMFHLVSYSEPHRMRILDEALRNGGTTAKMEKKMKAIASPIIKEKSRSILDKTAPIINKYLFCDESNFDSLNRQGKKVKAFGKSCPMVDTEGLLNNLIKKINENISQSTCRSLSKENWRKDVKDFLNPDNESDEVCFERNLAKHFKNNNLQNWWWNQMPVASGLVCSNADRRRAIDLVHWDERTGTYDLIELKIASNSPVYALMEIILYGLVYLVVRDNPIYLSEQSKTSAVFQAKKINLRVLAPRKYFEGYDLRRFEQELNAGFLKILANRVDGLTMSVMSYSHPAVKKRTEKQDSLDDLLNFGTWEEAFPS